MLGQRGPVKYPFPDSEPSSPSPLPTYGEASRDQPLAHGESSAKLSDLQTSRLVTTSAPLFSSNTFPVEPPCHPTGDGSSAPTVHGTQPPSCDAALASQLSSPLGWLVFDAIESSSLLSSSSSTSASAVIDLPSQPSFPPSTPVLDAAANEYAGHEQASQTMDEEDQHDAQQDDDLDSEDHLRGEDNLDDEDVAGDGEQSLLAA
jgi:hypothetical protein